MKEKSRKERVRAKLLGERQRPRLSVFVSNKHILAQIIDDVKGKTLVAASDKEVGSGKTVEVAKKVGEILGKKAIEKKILEVVFDRGGRRYHGRVQALAEGARAQGMKF
ncbi:MAG: 50S ribosomal protein L18 [bacterium]|nr:50S ribosomal protein L18 [bacterium]